MSNNKNEKKKKTNSKKDLKNIKLKPGKLLKLVDRVMRMRLLCK